MLLRSCRSAVSLAFVMFNLGCATSPPGLERVHRIETSLLPTVRFDDREYKATTIEEELRANRIPAVSVAVVHDGRVDWAKAYGLADESGRLATPRTLFQAASISKAVTSTGALAVVADGRLALDEDVNVKLKSWKVPSNEFTARAPVTLRRLLTHSAGLTVHGFPGYQPGTPVPTVVQILNGEPPSNTAPIHVDIEPGTKRRYSGGGFLVLQLLLGDVTGESFPTLMQERVLRPLGMNVSTFEQPLPASLTGEAATGYKADETPLPGRYQTQPEMAAAGLWTTPTDLARWIIGMQRAFAGNDSVLPRDIARQMLTRQFDSAGLGVTVEGEGDELRFEHGGANFGFRADLVGFVRRGEGIIVMTNSDAGDAIIGKIEQAVAREYGWPGFEPKRTHKVPISAQELAEYVGAYQMSERALQVAISVQSDKPFLTMPTGERIEIVHTGRDTFTTIGGGVVTFQRDAAGRIIALRAGDELLRRVK